MKQDINKILSMSYVDFMAFLEETNRPPGGKESIRLMVQNTFLSKDSKVLHVGCNTGSSTREVAHLAKCNCFGIDINRNMVKVAQKLARWDIYSKFLKFEEQDATSLSFKDNKFDLVFSAGSIAFMKKRDVAIKELIRVTKLWGFICDTVLYYRKTPPLSLLKKINNLTKMDLKPWGLNYWKSIYTDKHLEKYFLYKDTMRAKNTKEIKEYCFFMANKPHLNHYTKQDRDAIYNKLYKYMELFNENHKYLSYCVLIFRKLDYREEETLFGY